MDYYVFDHGMIELDPMIHSARWHFRDWCEIDRVHGCPAHTGTLRLPNDAPIIARSTI